MHTLYQNDTVFVWKLDSTDLVVQHVDLQIHLNRGSVFLLWNAYDTTAGVSPDVSHLLCCILPMLVVTLDVLTQSYKALQRQSVPLSGCPSSFGLVSFALL